VPSGWEYLMSAVPPLPLEGGPIFWVPRIEFITS